MLYGHGDDIYNKKEIKANFSSNVLPFGTDSSILNFIKTNNFSLENYPEPKAEPLTKAISDNINLPGENILPVGGATEAFYLIAELFKDKLSTILSPSFSEYEDACTKYNHKINFINNSTPLSIAIKGTDLIWICNPNNPDGKMFNTDNILNLAQKNKDIFFIIDEAYIDFCKDLETVIYKAIKLPNVIVIHSLTKKYVVPGLRLGYMVSNKTIIKSINKLLMPWRISSINIQIGIFILKELSINFYELQHRLLLESKYIQQSIAQIPSFKVIPSATNYFLVDCESPSEEIKRYLLDNYKILVRDASNFHGLNSHFIRISTQTRDKNNLLINALKEWNNIAK